MIDLYQHYKGPLYLVLDTVTDSTNANQDRSFVIYWSLERKALHVREKQEFFGTVIHNGKEVPRFRAIKKLIGP